jgi:hypothetical protein
MSNSKQMSRLRSIGRGLYGVLETPSAENALKVDERETGTGVAPRHGTNLTLTLNERSSSYLPHGGLILQPVG